MPSARSQYGLDGLNFFVANVQTGFGPFIAVYLTVEAWTQSQIGFALSIGTIAAMASQVPAGALVDAMRNKRLAALFAVLSITGSALLFAFWPARLPVYLAELLHGFASCVLSPALAAISLALVGRGALGERLGRNARYASLGSGLAAAVMGAFGTYIGERSVFLLTAALTVPGLVALVMIRPRDLRFVPSEPGVASPGSRPGSRRRTDWPSLWRLLLDRRMLVFSLCTGLFTLGNAALLPLAGGQITARAGSAANLVIAACIVVPQIIVALLSPSVGHGADRWGRKPLLLLGLAALPVRGLLFAALRDPSLLVVVQALDGISAASLGVLMPLVAADITRGTNRFNLCMGLIGLAVGVGATISTGIGGEVAQRFGHSVAYLFLASGGFLAWLLALLAMPETRPATEPADEVASSVASPAD
jgi:MFS family permease